MAKNLTKIHQFKDAPEMLRPGNLKDELALASRTMLSGYKALQERLPGLSKKGAQRVLFAALQLPEEDLPVALKSSLEQECFLICQRVQVARMILINNYIRQQVNEEKMLTAKQEEEEKKSEE